MRPNDQAICLYWVDQSIGERCAAYISRYRVRQLTEYTAGAAANEEDRKEEAEKKVEMVTQHCNAIHFVKAC